MTEKLVIKWNVQKMLDAASTSFAEHFWRKHQKDKHTEFSENLSRQIGVELIADDEQDDVNLEPQSKLIYSPFSLSVDCKVRYIVGTLAGDVEKLKVIQKEIYRIMTYVNKNHCYSMLFEDISALYKQIWKKCPIDYPEHESKKNSNCLFAVLTVLNASVAFLAGIDNSIPIELSERKHGKKHGTPKYFSY